MPATAAQLRADAKYKKEKVKAIHLAFYPGEHDLLEALKEKAKEYGGIKPYIKALVERDIYGPK